MEAHSYSSALTASSRCLSSGVSGMCLAVWLACPPLTCLARVQAFLSGAYKKDLNRDNPLGMKGELAEAFGTLMRLLWRVRVLHCQLLHLSAC